MRDDWEVDLADGGVRVEGALDIERTPEGIVPCRLPLDRADLFDPTLLMRAFHSVGVRLVTLTDAQRFAIELNCGGEGEATIDLLVQGELLPTRRFPTRETVRLKWDNLPARPKRLELYLPVWERTQIRRLWTNDDAKCFAWHDSRPRWITHGSSITGCRASTSPARSWPAIVARAHDWHHTNMGFGGQCLFDQTVARAIGRQPADCISLCLGINTYHSAFNERTWPSAALGFILTVREAHPHIPMVIISPIHSPQRETTAGSTGLTLPFMREQLRQIVEKLRSHGDQCLSYLDGLKLFNEGDVAMLPDNLHPNGEGYELMGHRMAKELDRLMMNPESAPAFAKMKRGTR